VRQYLDRHAEPEIAFAANLSQRFGHVLTIPAAGEAESLFDVLAAIPTGPLGPVLVILVVNESVDSPRWITEANRALLGRLECDWRHGSPCGQNATLFEREHGCVLLVDRASEGRRLPSKQGVGLARKIAADIALAIRAANGIESPWIHCTDADVSLPVDYFRQPLAADAEAAALIYPFRHVGERTVRAANRQTASHARPNDTESDRAALEYEISLRYYVRGLAHADSPYAFHTIGSTIAIAADAYAKVRGIPKRLAAEDFYLLNKLSKVGRIQSLAGLPIELSSRISHRVPFGTGRALADASTSRESRRLYHPAVFDHVGVWQSALGVMARTPQIDGRAALQQVDIPAGVKLGDLVAALDAIGELDRGPVRARSPVIRERQLRHAFDAGRTLRLVHTLRDSFLPSLGLVQALRDSVFVPFRSRPDAGIDGSGLGIDDLERIAIALGRPEV